MDYSQLLVGKSDKAGEVEFVVEGPDFFNQDIKEVTLFYNIVEDSRFKLFRNNKQELILVHVTEDWIRQAKLNISKYKEQLNVKITWGSNEDTLAIKGQDEEDFNTVKAVQIDN
ncbi:MAG: hypothetical protein FH758_12925 [Firmicutes bacterium]|nr:hypothetical protein [Bacillota bacterium]